MGGKSSHSLSKSYVKNNWLTSIGSDLTKEHFREKPPGTGHAVCDRENNICEVHEDRVNPHTDPIGHLVKDSPETLLELGVAAFFGIHTYSKTQDLKKSICSAAVSGITTHVSIEILKGILEVIGCAKSKKQA